MANIIWVFGVMCIIHNAQSSLPLLAEVKNRTRWCLGEGSHCPVNLLSSFSSCCKPYVCTEVPKTCKPAFVLKFTHYTDHRCMLPSSSLNPVTQQPKLYTNVSETESVGQDDELTSTEMIPVDNTSMEITTLQFANVSNLNLGEYEEMYEKALSAANETNSESNEISHSHLVNRPITKNFSENNKESNSEYSLTSAGEYNETNSFESESSSVENSNITSSSESEKSVINSETSQVLDSSGYKNFIMAEGQTNSSNLNISNYLNVNNAQLKNNSIPAVESSASLSTLPPLSNNSDVSEEDWTSSDMTYDTRPSLHKIVTIHPFRLFQSVELIKLNESVERSY